MVITPPPPPGSGVEVLMMLVVSPLSIVLPHPIRNGESVRIMYKMDIGSLSNTPNWNYWKTYPDLTSQENKSEEV